MALTERIPFVAKGGDHITGRRLGYARVSTAEQTIDMQVMALECAGCDHIYQDQGVSGVTIEREGLDRLLRDIRPLDTLVVWKLDRLGRSLSNLIFTLRGLHESGIAFISLRDVIDTTTASGRLSFHIMAALAEFERDLISERTKEGMKAAAKRGSKIGRPRKLAESDVLKVRHEWKNGRKIDTLARDHGVHPRTVYRYLHHDL